MTPRKNTHGVPAFIHRPTYNEHSQARVTATAQARSVNIRKAPVTLPKAPWLKQKEQHP